MREKRPGYWELRVYAGYDARAKRSLYVTGVCRGGKRQAETALAALVTDVDKGKTRPTKGTMAAFLEEWSTAALGGLAPKTVRSYLGEVKTHLTPGLGHLDVGKLSAADVERLYRGMLGDGLAPASVRHTHAVLRRALDDAVRWGWRADNPAAQARQPRLNRHEIEPPSLDVALRILREAAAWEPWLGVFVRVAAAAGARRGELCALRWTDLVGPVLRIARALDGRVEKDTKTHRRRAVTLDETTLAGLASHRQRMEARAARADLVLAPDAFVFSPAIDSMEPFHPDSITHRFAELAERCGCPTVRLHDLRHLSNSLLLDAGVDVVTVQRRHGHSSGQMTFDTYGHPVSGGDARAAKVMGDLLAPKVEFAARRDESRPA